MMRIRSTRHFAAADKTTPVRAVIHCAGRGGDRQRVLANDGTPGDLSMFHEVLRVNLGGTYNILRLAAVLTWRGTPSWTATGGALS